MFSGTHPRASLQRRIVVLAAILLAGGALRAAYLSEKVHEPDFEAPALDALYHDYWARAMLSGDWTPPNGKEDPSIRSTAYLRPPGYPWFLAAAYRLTGSGYLGARVVQMALGLANCLLGFYLGRRIFGETAGFLTALLMSVYWVFIYFEGELLSPVLEVSLFLALAHGLLNWPRSGFAIRWAAAAGLIVGLLALVRPNAALLILAAWVWMTWGVWVARQRNRRRLAAGLSAFSLAAILTVAPVTIRNSVVGGGFVPVSANFGLNLRANYNAQAGPAYWPVPELADLAGIATWDCFSYPRIVRALERREGFAPESMRYSTASSLLAREAFRYILDRPGHSAVLTLQRVLLLWGPREVTNNRVVALDRERSPVLRRTLLRFPAILSLSLLGIVLFLRTSGFRRDRGSYATGAETETHHTSAESGWLLLVLLAAYFLSLLPAPAGARFRVPMIPFLIVFSAFAVERVAQILCRGQWLRFCLYSLSLVALYAIVSRDYVAYEPSAAVWHMDRGTAWLSRGELDKAVESYREALDLDASLYDARNNLGAVLARTGHPEKAIPEYEAALRTCPKSAETHINLASAMETVGQAEGARQHYRIALELAPDHPVAWYNLGVLLSRLGKKQEAIAAYNKAIEIRPAFAEAHENLAAIFASEARWDEAAKSLRRAAQLRPNRAETHFSLAEALYRMGETQAAQTELLKSVAVRPDFAVGYLRLAELLAQSGSKTEARRYLERAAALAQERGDAALLSRVRACLETVAEPAPPSSNP